MSDKMKSHGSYTQDENGEPITQIAWIEPATEAQAAEMIDLPTTGHDARSDWAWFRLQNGDLIFGCFPQGDTYMNYSDGGVCDWKDGEAA